MSILLALYKWTHLRVTMCVGPCMLSERLDHRMYRATPSALSRLETE